MRSASDTFSVSRSVTEPVPLVSILIPCYNAEGWVAEAVQSALDQSHSPVEIVVVDDGSTDNSLQVLREFGDRIRLETGPNKGGNIARNRLLELSSGPWVQYLDADDCLLPNKITEQVQFIRNQPDVDVVFGPSVMEYHEGESTRREILVIPEPHDPWVLLARWYLPQTGSPLWRREALLNVGQWKPDQPCCQEHELYLRLLRAGKTFEYCAHAGSVYRQWSEDTLCKKDKPEVLRRRLSILEDTERHLEQTGELTFDRRQAINLARHESARLIWMREPGWAREVMRVIRSSDPGFRPGGPAAPTLYRACYRLIGFQGAEMIASLKRRVLGA